jgi:MFS family permease
MNNKLNLKELERKAFRSTYQDGLWDVYMGLIVIFMAVFIFRQDEGYGPWNLVLMVASFVLAYLVFWAGKKFVTVPRMGQVTFGSRRKKRKRTLAIIMGIIIVIQTGFVLLGVAGWLNAGFGARISVWLGGGSMERILVAAIGSLFVGPPMIIAAFFTEFLRGYYIAILMAGAVFLMILLNQPLYPVIIGLLILAPGVVLFVRFMRRYPLHREGEDHD